MTIRSARVAGLALLVLAAFSFHPVAAQTEYRLPPSPIPEILDQPPLPFASTSPDGRHLLLQERATMPPIAELAAPMLRLAGLRINPATNGAAGGGLSITGYRIRSLEDGSETVVRVPPGSLGMARWAPDGQRLTFTATLDDGVEQWVADAATGHATRVATGVNEAAGGCSWMPDSQRLLCLLVPAARGAPPVEPRAPAGPSVQETRGRRAPVRTYQDMLQNVHDEALFEYYMTSQPGLVDVAGGAVVPVGGPALYRGVEASPDGRYLLVQRLQPPWSYLVPVWSFAMVVEVWDERGQVVRTVADLPLADAVPIGGVRTGPRQFQWRPLRSATLVWVEALDGGDSRSEADERDRVLTLDAPFDGVPGELARTAERFGGMAWGEDGVALLTEFNRSQRWQWTWVVDADRPRAERRLLWDRSMEDAYTDPGRPELRTTPTGERVLLQHGDWIYLTGAGATPEGDRPFLDRLSLATLETERLWRSAGNEYESVAAVLDAGAGRVLTRHESPSSPLNYFVMELETGQRMAVTEFQDPAPQLRGIQRQLVVYEREDGVPLNGTLYLPADHRAGERLPVVVWAYPREFVSADAAGQVRTSDNRFTTISGPSHLFFLTQGYAVFDGPSMPIIGGDTANDTYVEQLVASARAAVEKLVDMGVADPDRIGVGGHSYGAFMTANLLAHSDLFQAGIARSGAYNRTLTPFGFQNEQRTFWEAPEVYFAMSPFMHAHAIDQPILLIHGEVDNNSGTFPIQSERLFHAINGLGGTARLVMLPHESHGYRARESVLHALAEMIEWFDVHVKGAAPPVRDVATDP
jgi:dipeptidyl aminopeptidase/acylaminoacyl peptidase